MATNSIHQDSAGAVPKILPVPEESPHSSSMAERVQLVPLDKIAFSPTNPRKNINQQELQNLANNILSQGLIEPIVVRQIDIETGEAFEICAGERRARAFSILRARPIDGHKYSSIPAIVRDISDEQLLEMQISENRHREDLTPLDWAAAYRAKVEMERRKQGEGEGSERGAVAVAAAKLGMSVSVLYQTLQLDKLIPKAADYLRAEKITKNHGIDCARLAPGDQEKYLEQCFRRNWRNWTNEHGKAASVREMRQWIEEEIRCDLEEAPFSLEDEDLCPEAGPCTSCRKMSGANPELLADLSGIAESGGRKKSKKGARNLCFDPSCYRNKIARFVEIKAMDLAAHADVKPSEVVRIWGGDSYDRPHKGPESKYLADGDYVEVKQGDCDYAAPAIISGGDDLGKTLTVCSNKKCKQHHHASPSSPYRSPGLSPSGKKARARRELEKQVRAEAIRQIMAATAASHQPAPIEDLQVMAIAMFVRLDQDHQRPLAKLLGWGKTKEKASREWGSSETYEQTARVTLPTYSRGKLLQFMLTCALAHDLHIWSFQSDLKNTTYLGDVGKRYGVDLVAIRAELAQQVAAKKAVKGKKASKS
jgi:ParB/RepB/Spo0J family partition protein